MATRNRSVMEKVGDWEVAYRAVSASITADKLREQLNAVINTPLPQDPDGVVTYVARMNAAMALARLVSANDRSAGTIAALITQSGIKPAAIDYGDDT